MVHTANYYEKINDKFVALYKVYDNSYETSSKEKAFQFEVLLQDFNYKELRYDVTDMFSPAAVYREVDGQIIIEDNISRLKFEYYYDDPFAQVGLFGDYGKIKFVFNFSDTGVEGYAETELESQKFSFKFNKINPDEEFNIDNEKEHGTEGDILYLKQYFFFLHTFLKLVPTIYCTSSFDLNLTTFCILPPHILSHIGFRKYANT